MILGLVAASPPGARAAVSVDIVWTSTTGAGTTGGSSITAAAGDQLVAEVRISPDAGGVAAYSVSVEFDTDLGNELDLVSVTEFLPASLSFNFTPGSVDSTQESTAAQLGNVLSMEAGTLGMGPTSGTFVAAELTFDVTANVSSDGDDLFTGLFDDAWDGAGDNASSEITPVFGTASVNQAASSPVPALPPFAWIALLLLLMAALAWARMRRLPLPR